MKKVFSSLLSLLLIFGLLLSPAAAADAPAASTFSIQFIDVGQADAALVECDGHYMLIDGGNKADSSLIYIILKNKNIAKLDIVAATHAHEDHVGGLAGALNFSKADLILCPTKAYGTDAFNDFKKYADQNGGITVPAVGAAYKLGSADVKIVGVNGGTDTNDTSIVLKIVYGQTSFLFTGDAEREAEQTILNSKADISATVLKVGHHGSESSTTYPFLREIMPKYAVISVGAGNSYGHPNDNTLSRLRDAGAVVYRTDQNGDIICKSDGVNVTFAVSKTPASASAAGKATSAASASTSVSVPAATAAAPAAQAANAQTYILNTNTKKIHYPYCRSVKAMAEKNKRQYTGTTAELIAQGYSPCKNCNP